jgi:hypothetical protein
MPGFARSCRAASRPPRARPRGAPPPPPATAHHRQESPGRVAHFPHRRGVNLEHRRIETLAHDGVNGRRVCLAESDAASRPDEQSFVVVHPGVDLADVNRRSVARLVEPPPVHFVGQLAGGHDPIALLPQDIGHRLVKRQPPVRWRGAVICREDHRLDPQDQSRTPDRTLKPPLLFSQFLERLLCLRELALDLGSVDVECSVE